jgi:hypothetical protein
MIEASPRLIENDLNDNSRENLNPGQDVYFYSIQDGQILGKVINSSVKDFGCTNMYVERTGNGAFNLYQSRNPFALHKVADKIVRIEPALVYKASTTVRLFFTEQQLKALEAATNQPRSAFRVYHVNAASYAQANNRNTAVLVPAYSPVPGVGGAFTVLFNDRPVGSYALGTAVSVLGEGPEAGLQNPDWQFGRIYPNPADGNVLLAITAPGQQRIGIEVINTTGQTISRQTESVVQGYNRITIQLEKFIAGNYLVRIRDEKGNLLYSQSLIKL